MCQVGGWGMTVLLNVFFYITLSVREVDDFYLLIIINAILGIIFTHLMRLFIREHRMLELPVNRQLLFFLLLSLFFGFLFALFYENITKAFDLGKNVNPKLSRSNELARSTLNNFFLLVVWNLIYVVYHYVERNRKQELHTLRLQALVKELELKTIKSHINPHFIFNALNSIRALVDENPGRARTAITELSNILRSSMQAEKLETVPLEKELGIVRDYLALEKIRFEERLQVGMQIAPDTLTLPVPPMMLQNLVENAIKHGISRNETGGIVNIISSVGISHHDITVVNTGTYEEVASRQGFGLKSTMDRLNLLFAGNAHFSITNLEGNLVKSTVSIPIVSNGPLNDL